MRGTEDHQEEVFSYIPLEKRVGAEHPLRKIRAMSDRALAEFVGLKLDEPVWDVTVFTKNRERLLGGEVVGAIFRASDGAGARWWVVGGRTLYSRRKFD